jgi:hypothetical protein
MPQYQFYAIKPDGHVSGPPAEWNLPNDSEALKEARQMIDGHDVELWQNSRMIAYLTPHDK